MRAGLAWARACLRLDWRGALGRPDLRFLVPLGCGIAGAVLFFTRVVPLPRLIHTHPEHVYALFFGLIAGSIVIHFGYHAGVIGGYRNGDLSQVYPIARGSAPVLVALGAWLLAGEALGPLELLGVLVVSLGIVSLSDQGGYAATLIVHWHDGAPDCTRHVGTKRTL